MVTIDGDGSMVAYNTDSVADIFLESIILSLLVWLHHDSPHTLDRELLQNENFDTRDFTIFIANKQWIKNILRPLLELCAKDDSMLAMRCCGLALVLVRRLSDESQKTIKQLSSKTRKASSQDLQANEEEKDLQDKDIGHGKESVTDANAQSVVAAVAAAQKRAINVQQQLSALLSFKEALCSGECPP